ncbi:MAG TPA: di-trans,poly-cis-decaprenylcistransferase [Terriglobales bacterium]|nr:di-trans,poly-cis-decaprenylcistransferase [Terriglobales bacterium]
MELQSGESRREGLHVAIIMDGNGRWAKRRGLPRVAGHRAGAMAVRRTIESAPSLGIGTLTLFAFSADNWSRPQSEVSALMKLFHRYLRYEVTRLIHESVRLSVIGRRDRLPRALVRTIEATEQATRGGSRLHLRVAVDYSARDTILQAAQKMIETGETSRQAFGLCLRQAMNDELDSPDVDLMIRTSGELRLSDFLLWECAYAELYFTSVLWPEFGKAELAKAVAEFHRRERRFGAVLEARDISQMPGSPPTAATSVPELAAE